ncbi:MAG: hypothetical protein EOO20_28175 [Chryseobacterium sp.]|nr:MAG: hypothetical protein EOO20_28175 [Chryseobacterium sp.]
MKKEIASQYRAALKMLGSVISRCPEDLWNDTSYKNRYWQIAYHTLHYTLLYLSENEDAFIPYNNHISGYHILGQELETEQSRTYIPGFSKEDLLGYLTKISSAVERHMEKQDLTAPSGFEWLLMNRFELHLYNIRHIQHHTAQLIERLHQNGIEGIAWVDTDAG